MIKIKTKVKIDIFVVMALLIIFVNMVSANVPTITDFQVVPNSHINRTNPANMFANVTDDDLLRVQFGIVDINGLIRYNNTVIFIYENLTGVEGIYKSIPWSAKVWQLTNDTNIGAYVTSYFIENPNCPSTICKSNIMVPADFKKNDTADNITIFLWFSESTGNLSNITTPDTRSIEIESGVSTFSTIRDIYSDGIDNPPTRYISNQHYILYNIGDSRNAFLTSSTVPDGFYKAMVRAEDPVNSNTLWTDIDTIRIAPDETPPASITGLKNITYKPTYINWTWIDPKDVDFAKVKVYINGVFKTDVLKGKRYYKATGLIANTLYKISTHTVDTSGNINQTWVNKSTRTAKDGIPSSSVNKLHDISYAPTYINWTWIDPKDPDLSYIKVYIDGIWKKNVLKGIRYYNLTGLLPNTTHKISTRTVDTSGNMNKTWVNHTAKTTPKSYVLKIITVGDPHIDDDGTDESNEAIQNLKDVVSYSNGTDVNVVVVLGDVTDDKSTSEFELSRSILNKLKKEYFVIPGSHDISSYNETDWRFEKYFGSMEKIKVRNTYQLLFIGMWKEIGSDGKQILHWKYNFSKANKNMPTLVFIHGAVKDPPPGYPCSWSERYFKYGASMQAELDKFNKLIGVYSSHVHDDTDQVFSTPLVPQVRYTTINGLSYADTGCILADPSTKVGYSLVKDGKLTYGLVPYKSGTIISESIGNESIGIKKKVYKKLEE